MALGYILLAWLLVASAVALWVGKSIRLADVHAVHPEQPAQEAAS